jgi:hypothetical protein
MKLADTVLISLSIGFMMMGIHQTYTNGFAGSYIFFMTMLTLLGIYQLRKLNAGKKVNESLNNKKNQRKKHKI